MNLQMGKLAGTMGEREELVGLSDSFFPLCS